MQQRRASASGLDSSCSSQDYFVRQCTAHPSSKHFRHSQCHCWIPERFFDNTERRCEKCCGVARKVVSGTGAVSGFGWAASSAPISPKMSRVSDTSMPWYLTSYRGIQMRARQTAPMLAQAVSRTSQMRRNLRCCRPESNPFGAPKIGPYCVSYISYSLHPLRTWVRWPAELIQPSRGKLQATDEQAHHAAKGEQAESRGTWRVTKRATITGARPRATLLPKRAKHSNPRN